MTFRENPHDTMTAAVAVVPSSTATSASLTDPLGQFEQRLGSWLGSSGDATALHAAIRYAALAPGKRTRPALVLEIAGHDLNALDIACAIEMIHAASLILDDLPCMDDAGLRRGRATTHIVFGQPAAILAAVSLIALAFRVIGALPVSQQQSSALVQDLAAAIGTDGMSGGQMLDLEADAQSLVSAEMVNTMKTGALFVAAVNMSAEVANLSRAQKDSLTQFAVHLGLAFQIYDDIKDATLDESTAGKTVRADKDKPTVVNQLGARKSWSHLLNRIVRAEKCFAAAGFDASRLRKIFAPVYDAV